MGFLQIDLIIQRADRVARKAECPRMRIGDPEVFHRAEVAVSTLKEGQGVQQKGQPLIPHCGYCNWIFQLAKKNTN